MTKDQMDDVLEFLRSFISGGVNQDFKPWASELYQKLYRSGDEPSAQALCQCATYCMRAAGAIYDPPIKCRGLTSPDPGAARRFK